VKAKRRKRRSRPSLRTRIGTYWVLGLMLVAVTGYALYALVTAPVFRVRSVGVTGLAHVATSDVVRRAAIDRRANVWLLDRAGIQRRIEAIPYVATARVHVTPPAHVWLDVVERTAEGCVRELRGGSYTVDAALRVLEPGCTGAEALTYVVRARLGAEPGAFLHDPELLLLQADAKALAANGDRYRSFAHDSYGDLEATLADGIDVKFGNDGDLERKQRLVAPILAELGPRLGSVRTVDLRAPATPVVEYRPGRQDPSPAP